MKKPDSVSSFMKQQQQQKKKTCQFFKYEKIKLDQIFEIEKIQYLKPRVL
jgi:hypothetical protein